MLALSMVFFPFQDKTMSFFSDIILFYPIRNSSANSFYSPIDRKFLTGLAAEGLSRTPCRMG